MTTRPLAASRSPTAHAAHDGAHGFALHALVFVAISTAALFLLAGLYGVSFAGRAIDPERIRKQTEGGMIFALGQALMEEVVFDAGELANGNLSDYQLPSIVDSPVEISSTVLTDPDPHATPHGVGENTVPPIAPAIANAVHAATGARIRELPLTAERVLRAIREKEAP